MTGKKSQRPAQRAKKPSRRSPSRRRADHHEIDLLQGRLATQEHNSKVQIEALKLQVSALQQRLKLMGDRLETLERSKPDKTTPKR